MASSQAQHDLKDFLWRTFSTVANSSFIFGITQNIQARCMLWKPVTTYDFVAILYYRRLKRLSFCFVLFCLYFLLILWLHKNCVRINFSASRQLRGLFAFSWPFICVSLSRIVCSAEFITYHPLYEQTAKSELRCQLLVNANNSKPTKYGAHKEHNNIFILCRRLNTHIQMSQHMQRIFTGPISSLWYMSSLCLYARKQRQWFMWWLLYTYTPCTCVLLLEPLKFMF